VVTGRLKISDHRGPITDASFSPDGTAIATASADGQVKFFQVVFDGQSSLTTLKGLFTRNTNFVLRRWGQGDPFARHRPTQLKTILP
jgi:WD40 repeat protein